MTCNIDHIFYINLDRREDRRVEIEGELDRFGISGERFSAIPHEFGIAGCTMSHLEVLKLARDRQYKNVLIMEDDFMFTVEPEQFQNTLTEFFEIDIKYKVLMLAYNTEEGALANIPGTELVRRVVHARTASCYLVDASYFDTLIKLYEMAVPKLIETRQHWVYANDCVWRDLQLLDIWLATSVRMGIQRPSWSDNSKCWAAYGV